MSKEAWMWLVSGLGFGAVNTGEILAAYPEGAEAIADDLGSETLDELLTMKQAEKLGASRPEDFALRLAHAETLGVEALGFDDPRYPGMLRDITNPPPILFVKGDITLLNGQLSVGMVGSRRPSAYGVEATKSLGRGIAMGGAIIVSGLAAGLDSEAHKAALAVNGPTIACIAFGHDTCYPAANKKLKEVIERYGAVVSEYPIGTPPEKPYFLQRNRIIAGLSHALVVLEARQQSGTMSTVNFASDYGRDVFAVPGSIFSELSGGTNAMIREGSYVAASANDVLGLYGIEIDEELAEKEANMQAAEGRPAASTATGGLRQLQSHSAVPFAPILQSLDEPAPPRPQEAAAAKETPAASAGGKRAAIESIRKLQQANPPRSDEALDARNRELDERIAAVSDSVEIGGAPAAKSGVRPKTIIDEKGRTIQPFSWDRVEHIETGKPPKKRQEPEKRAARRRPATPIKAAGPVPFTPSDGRVSRVEPITAVSGIQGIDAVSPVASINRAERAIISSAGGSQSAAPSFNDDFMAEQFPIITSKPTTWTAPEEPPPILRPKQTTPAIQQLVSAAPKAEPPAAKPKPKPKPQPPAQDSDDPIPSSLSGKLRTLGSRAEVDTTEESGPPAVTFAPSFTARAEEDAAPAEPVQSPGPGIVFNSFSAADAPKARTPQDELEDAEALQIDPLGLLSENARRAYDQLGAQPVALNQICSRSGLSSGEAMAALTELELAGLSRQLAGRQFVIMQ